MGNKTATLAGLAVFALSFLSSHPTAHVNVPDWLRTAAQQPIPHYPNDPKAVVLYSEKLTSVKDNGDIETLHRGAIKILRPEGRTWGKVEVYFDKDTSIRYIHGWSLPISGKEYEVTAKDATESGSFGELYSDDRVKELTIPAAEPGNVIGYEYVQRGRPYVYQDIWWFQRSVPVQKTRFSLALPSGWTYQTHWANHPSVAPGGTGANELTWELDNLAAPPEEPHMPPLRAILGYMVVAFIPPNSNSATNQSSWEGIGSWYANLTADRRQASGELQQMTADITAGAHTPLEQMNAIATFLQRQVRYVDIEIGIGGYQPHFASDVFRHRYGDCKDKATLMSSMLAQKGIHSYLLLVHTQRGDVLPDVPSMFSFNHAILAIRVPEGTPENTLFALEDVQSLGRLLIFDPTDQYTPLGYIRPDLQDSYALLVTDNGGQLLKLPLLAPSMDRLMRVASFTLDPTGTLTGKVQEVRWGWEATWNRAEYLLTEKTKRLKLIERYLAEFLPQFTVLEDRIGNLEEYDQNLQFDYRFVAKNYAQAAGNLLLLRPRVLGSKTSAFPPELLDPTKTRHYPVELGGPTVQNDLFDFQLPEGYSAKDLPKPISLQFPFGSYKSSMEATGNTLRYKRTYQLNKAVVTMDQMDDFKKFVRAIHEDEQTAIVVKHE